MNLFDLAAVIVSAAAILAYVNHQVLRLPMTIGVMVLSLGCSLIMVLAGRLGFTSMETWAIQVLAQVDFNEALMHGMLSFLLFAGALHVNLDDLKRQGPIIAVMATVGTVGSTFVNGFLAFWILDLLGIGLPFIYCLVFGALISPTDPIAVIGILRVSGTPKTLETQIVGESLFNDGVAVVVFLVLLGIASGDFDPTPTAVSLLLLEEAGGGIVFGLILGALGIGALRTVDNYSVEALITLAIVMGGYAASFAMHVSGPLAMVVAGLIIGNHGRRWAMSEQTRAHVDTFWELIDEVGNAVLFLLIGLEVLLLAFGASTIAASLLLIPAVLLCRMFWVGLPVLLLQRVMPFSTHAIKILTWAGLRGGISVALALSLPDGPERDTLLVITYVIVIFSIVVQGLTTGPLIRKLDPVPRDAG